jgi:hypothetical protein
MFCGKTDDQASITSVIATMTADGRACGKIEMRSGEISCDPVFWTVHFFHLSSKIAEVDKTII